MRSCDTSFDVCIKIFIVPTKLNFFHNEIFSFQSIVQSYYKEDGCISLFELHKDNFTQLMNGYKFKRKVGWTDRYTETLLAEGQFKPCSAGVSYCTREVPWVSAKAIQQGSFTVPFAFWGLCKCSLGDMLVKFPMGQ